ncbi:ATP-binding protein [Murimonas intestini]
MNILENALKYSPFRSKIQISVKCQVSYVQISFRDQGVGFTLPG